MADANGHNSVPQLPPLLTFGASESQQHGQQLPRVGVTFAPGVAPAVGTEGAAVTASLSADAITPPRTIVLNSAASAASSITNNGTMEAVINSGATKSPAMPDFSRPRSDGSFDVDCEWKCGVGGEAAEGLVGSGWGKENDELHSVKCY